MNKRIVYLANATEIHTKRWVWHFERKGFQIFVLSLHNSDIGNQHVIPLVEQARYHWLSVVLKARRLIKAINPLFVHAHYGGSYGLIGALVGFHPLILSVWGSDIYEFPHLSKVRELILRYNLHKADTICSTSHAMSEEARNYTRKVAIVTPFGIECQEYRPFRERDDEDRQVIVIGTVKKLDYPYGIDILIKAFSRVVESNPGIALELHLVGDGPLRRELEGLVQRLEIGDLVTFQGRVTQDQVPQYINQFDVFAALSMNESFGVAVLEASACGLPVVVSNAGGLPEVVKDRTTGFIVPVGDVLEAAHALDKLVKNPDLRRKMGNAGRDFVVANYEWRNTAKVMEKIYEQIIKGRS
jgi:L-malate glycosyltransferase